MKHYLLGSALLIFALAVSMPAQAQTLEERVTALETQVTGLLANTQTIIDVLTNSIVPPINALNSALVVQ